MDPVCARKRVFPQQPRRGSAGMPHPPWILSALLPILCWMPSMSWRLQILRSINRCEHCVCKKTHRTIYTLRVQERVTSAGSRL